MSIKTIRKSGVGLSIRQTRDLYIHINSVNGWTYGHHTSIIRKILSTYKFGIVLPGNGIIASLLYYMTEKSLKDRGIAISGYAPD